MANEGAVTMLVMILLLMRILVSKVVGRRSCCWWLLLMRILVRKVVGRRWLRRCRWHCSPPWLLRCNRKNQAKCHMQGRNSDFWFYLQKLFEKIIFPKIWKSLWNAIIRLQEKFEFQKFCRQILPKFFEFWPKKLNFGPKFSLLYQNLNFT